MIIAISPRRRRPRRSAEYTSAYFTIVFSMRCQDFAEGASLIIEIYRFEEASRLADRRGLRRRRWSRRSPMPSFRLTASDGDIAAGAEGRRIPTDGAAFIAAASP